MAEDWTTWQTNDGFWIDAEGVRIDIGPSGGGDVEDDVERIKHLILAAPPLLEALELICENPDYDLLPTERADAEAAIRQARRTD
jgi:hypothetical protein